MLECFFCFYRKAVLTDKLFEEGCELIDRDKLAIWFWIKSQMLDGAVCIKINTKPQPDAFDVEINAGSIIFNIH